MATRTYGLFEDQNKASFNHGGKIDGLKTLKKGVSGRKPLGDLSNSVNPVPNQASKKPNSNVNSFAVKEPAFTKVTKGTSKKKSISGASEKNKLQVSGRKALADISNSGKPAVVERSKKSLKATGKLPVVSEGSAHHSIVSEECFLHNHQECINSQKRSMDVDGFLKIVGLDYGSLSTWSSPPRTSKLKSDPPLSTFDLEEMNEQLPLPQDDQPSSPGKLELSSFIGTPRSDICSGRWSEDEVVNFRLLESPTASSVRF